jgi:uncharacterized protein (TIGR03067 family)
VKENTFTWTTLDGQRVEGRFQLDPASRPKAIDVTFQLGNAASMVGIYELDGDNWTLCITGEGGRPTEFVSRPGSRTMIITLKRTAN